MLGNKYDVPRVSGAVTEEIHQASIKVGFYGNANIIIVMKK